MYKETTVAAIVDRLRETGLEVYFKDGTLEFTVRYGTDDSTWSEFKFGLKEEVQGFQNQCVSMNW